MPRRVLLAIALACGAIAALAYWIDTRRVPVVVAARAIEGESTITGDDLATRELPPDALPEDAVLDATRLIGRTIHTPLAPGQLLLGSSFEGASGYRSGIRPPLGWRSVALPVSPATALGGAIAPGARVDVVAIPISGRAPADRGVERLATGLLVLDVRSEAGGPFVEPGREKGGAFANARLGSVIVAVPPQDDLRFADRIATSTFILFRSP